MFAFTANFCFHCYARRSIKASFLLYALLTPAITRIQLPSFTELIKQNFIADERYAAAARGNMV